jgi:hypothetical protein
VTEESPRDAATNAGTDPWQPNFKWNLRASYGVAALGGAGAIEGMILQRVEWFVAGAVVSLVALLLPRLHGRTKFGAPSIVTAEGDVTPVGDPRPKEEEVTVVEPRDDAPPPGGSSPRSE